jgi:FkbM family methyltransferase
MTGFSRSRGHRDYSARVHPSVESPFHHYNARFDALETIEAHARSDLVPHPAYLTNFLGVRIDPKFLPQILHGREGEVEPIPIPANWHADIAEWAAALRAVDLAKSRFTMAELGCGWGCWMNNTGAAARARGLEVQLAGVEADQGHIAFAREACSINGFSPEQVALHHGIAGASSGWALFPRQEVAGEEWGLEPTFEASPEGRREAVASGNFDELPVIALADVIGENAKLDLLHIDIQGGEADLIESARSVLDERVAYLLVGTHSRQIEGRLFSTLLGSSWQLEIERPAILALNDSGPSTLVDGVQGWRNLEIAPN